MIRRLSIAAIAVTLLAWLLRRPPCEAVVPLEPTDDPDAPGDIGAYLERERDRLYAEYADRHEMEAQEAAEFHAELTRLTREAVEQTEEQWRHLIETPAQPLVIPTPAPPYGLWEAPYGPGYSPFYSGPTQVTS